MADCLPASGHLFKEDARPNGTSTFSGTAVKVTLKLAEIYWNEKGRRISDVLIGGNEVVSNLDLFARVGRYAAYDHVQLVNVKDGMLNITLRTDKNNAKVNAMLVQPAN
ncbi:MAG: malectin [Syntrophobacteraceae bacterium]|jgi:hypothetical protein|nr:malectin [Syntrophobacteraceae bacterium]